ncbi:adenylate/guanylate cyclase domain-containing protein [Nocardioides marmorisolisilvae]|uniref:Adenylate/guanylate cyclase domain-containing protein n=1 Tax=Nocardioides marmorisolisilvae TaxID=1542737 RepID=A0A3N0E0K5_9ACTN|nr:adenylate/guanylate cyclase domain-containing protein [Nocardioides marmorisolisilvae]RNL81365.1 adenylate/guanylate cyclase domain-containing protein [Nocardioides marmorisolisilvae]
MTRPDGWPVVSELTSPETHWGLRFTDTSVESDYRTWRREHVRSFTQLAMYGAAGAAFCAFVAVIFGALGDGHLKTIALLLIPAMIGLMLAGAWVIGDEERAHLAMPWSAIANLIGGILAVTLTYPRHDPSLTGACVTMSAYVGLTMFRLTPKLALVAVAPYCLIAAGAAVRMHSATADVSDADLAVGLFIPLTALLVGMVLNLSVEWLTRQTYVDHLIIETQQEALFEERSNMARFVSPDIAETAHLSGLGMEIRTEIYSLTAVSIDLRGFTTFTQRHGAEFMVQVLHEYYAVVIDSAAEYGATVKDFAGDGALILVGAPFPRPDHPRIGLRLARHMMSQVRAVTDKWSTPETPLGIGIGLSSGECAVGAIGTDAQLEYAAIGTTVNLSARLCSIAQDGQILMGPGTARALEEAPGWSREVLNLAGIPEPVEVTIEDTRVAPPVLTTPGTVPFQRPHASADYGDDEQPEPVEAPAD